MFDWVEDFFSRLFHGAMVVGRAFIVMRFYPKMILAPLTTLILMMGLFFTAVHLTPSSSFEGWSKLEIISLLILYIVSFNFPMIVGCSLLSEMVQDMEEKREARYFTALKRVFVNNFIRLVPLFILWVFIDIISLIFRSREREGECNENIGISILGDGLRVSAYVYITTISRNQISSKKAFKEAYSSIRLTFATFLGGVLGVGVFIGLLALPSLFVFRIYGYEYIENVAVLGATIWLFIILALRSFIEQMLATELYLWYKKYKHQCETAKEQNKIPPRSIYDVKRPEMIDSLLDYVE